jgi:nucleoporin GLE1
LTPVSTASHPHARNFCLALAAKKILRQGEEVVSSDPKSAFPAATLALALWDQFPEFGTLLLGYLFEFCPFLVPRHPQRKEGQSDKEWYLTLGYKYEGDEVEKQDKYLKRMSGVARLYAALSVAHLPKASATTSHPHSLQRLWSHLASLANLEPVTDISASLLLQVLEVAGHALHTR